MPCNDGGPSYDDEMKIRLDLATLLLCELTAKVPKKYIQSVTGLEGWVNQHAAQDKARRERETRERAAEKKQLQAKIEELKKRMEEL